MRLKKLVLHGFKSFADRTEFKFDQPVTCVVGPNGCGKSNVVDAIKWVLGEQSAKSLRGGAMLDVIFNGADARKAAGMAEVELVFENPHRDDGNRYLTVDTDEVSVMRRLWRDGTSEYLINQQGGRLKDIKELFLDTGVGVDAYSIIEQGRVARLLEANPVERRQIFEEAAGISRFKVRKKEAQRKLEKVDDNLARLGDITKELESRLRSVRIQAGRARTYQELAQRLGELRLQHALHEYHTLNNRLTKLKAQQDDARFRGLGKVHQKRANYEAAMSYSKQAYNIADSLRNKLILAEAASVLAQLFKLRGEHQRALHFFELAHSITDSVVSENYLRKLAFTESQNEIDNKQARIKLLSAEKGLQEQKLKNELFIKRIILIAFVLGIILSILIIRNINAKRKKIESQKDHIETQRASIEHSYENLKSTQAQLLQKEKMASLGELTAGIAHEIQNPLNFVNNFSAVNCELLVEMRQEISKKNYDEVNELAKDIEDNELKINEHGKRADSIVKGMLLHSRTTSGSKELTDLNKQADEFLRLSFHGFRAKDKAFNTRIETEYDPSVGSIHVVPQEIGRVLVNLFNNAFYAVSDKKAKQQDGYDPLVFVSIQRAGDRVVVTVKDNGSGIPQKVIDKIFQPFFTTKPTGQGTGLGLSLAYDIIKAHGGEVQVSSIEDEYTKFVVSIPG